MPEATVAAIIIRETDGRENILLTLRKNDPFRGVWCLPGGHVDQDESVERAISREVLEETGLVFNGKFFWYFEEIFPELKIHNVVLVFKGEATGTLAAETEEVAESRWIPAKEISGMQLAFTHNDVIAAYIQNMEKESL